MIEITIRFSVVDGKRLFNALLIRKFETYSHSGTGFGAWNTASAPLKDAPIVNLEVDNMRSVRNESIEELRPSVWRINIVAKLFELGYITIEYLFSFLSIHN